MEILYLQCPEESDSDTESSKIKSNSGKELESQKDLKGK